ncbi:MAG: LPS-assembly protein LptD [Gammaproteobacteria bacterium]|nr:LPS-assembly protein LptD [Gammaproteobacteria bacterium]
MPFKKHLLCSEMALILTAGLLLSSAPNSATAQLPEYSCRANETGDGWICGSADGEPLRTRARPLRQESTAASPNSETEENTAAPSLGTETENRTGIEEGATNTEAPTESGQTATAPVSSYKLDWIPREEMSEEQLETLAANCCGGFVDPSGREKNSEDDPANATTLFTADQGFSQPAPDTISIDGDVVVSQGYRSIENNASTSINNSENTVLMQGDVVFREPGILLQGDSAFIDSGDGINRVTSAQYVLHDYGAHGQASAIVYNSESGLVTIENGEFSRCEPDNKFWHFEAESIVLDQELGLGYASAVKLKIKDVPIFYYPGTLPFPLGDERISGLLAPSTGSTRSGGFDFELPYYLNLAPNYDATISPRLISDRGVMTGVELRYLSSWSMNTVNMSYLGGDKLFDESTVNVPGTDSPPVEDRWFIGYEHFGNPGRNWSSYVDYNAVSDEDYFYDLGSGGLNVTSRTHLNRQAVLNFNSDYLRAGLNVQRIQIIDPFIGDSDLSRPYDRLPQLNFETGSYLAGGFRIGISGEVSSFDRSLDEGLLSPDQVIGGALVKGERINLEPELSWSVEEQGWFLRANAKYKHASYKLQNQATGNIDDPDIGIASYNLDTGLVFDRSMSRGYTQTLEPRLFYLFSEFEDQSHLPLFDSSELNFSFSQLFREDRFSGGDRIGDADQLTFALTSRILDEKGKERARFSLGQITYFEDRLVGLNNPLQTWIPRYSPLSTSSALAGEFAYSLGETWRLNTDVQWNEDEQELDEGSFQLRYQGDEERLLNFAYRYRNLVSTPTFLLPPGIDPRIKQTDISGGWPISANWKLLARFNYDHSNSRNLETFAGVEYSNCCATIRLIGREWVDEDELFLPNIEPDRGIFVQFTLNGLGNLTGGSLSSLLSDGIRGFKETEDE